MLKKELILKDPLKCLGYETEEGVSNGGFGAVIARAGVGKTAFLVQIAISTLLKGNNVLHISVKDPVEKVSLWYREMFQNITKPYAAKQASQLWEELLGHRFIMTFESEGFDFKKLKKRVAELRTQSIFTPQTIVIDGAVFDSALLPDLVALKHLARANRETIWFSIRTHRHEALDPASLIQPPEGGSDTLFDIVIQLIPEKERIRIKSVTAGHKGSDAGSKLFLDPSTMLIQED
jgi:hypothetical protein